MGRPRWGRDVVDAMIGSSIVGVGAKRHPLFTLSAGEAGRAETSMQMPIRLFLIRAAADYFLMTPDFPCNCLENGGGGRC